MNIMFLIEQESESYRVAFKYMNNFNEELYVAYDLENKEYWLYYIHNGKAFLDKMHLL